MWVRRVNREIERWVGQSAETATHIYPQPTRRFPQLYTVK